MNDEVQERRDIILGSTKGALSDTATGANPSNSAALETVVEVRTAAGSEALVSAAERPKATGSESMKESCIAVDAKYEGGGSKTGNWDGEKMCRICYLSSDRRSDGSDLMQLGCGCKDELGIAHRHCAETWFKLKGNRCCEICGKPAKNITGAGDNRFMEEWNDRRRSRLGTSISSDRGRCWRSQPFCNFLLSCIVIAFILPWFFHVKMF